MTFLCDHIKQNQYTVFDGVLCTGCLSDSRNFGGLQIGMWGNFTGWMPCLSTPLDLSLSVLYKLTPLRRNASVDGNFFAAAPQEQEFGMIGSGSL